jgi:hypothetical protein
MVPVSGYTRVVASEEVVVGLSCSVRASMLPLPPRSSPSEPKHPGEKAPAPSLEQYPTDLHLLPAAGYTRSQCV